VASLESGAMADYTITNLKRDVDDMAPQFGLEEIEARFARDALDCQNFGLSYQRLDPNARNSFGHRHKEQEEVYVVLEGAGRVKLDDDIQEVAPWDAVRVAPATIRCFEAGPDGLAFVAFGAPNTKGQDVEMIPGWWSD
jgi:mannose-6-phosphate isomerase-like protein (cupin superfamily)